MMLSLCSINTMRKTHHEHDWIREFNVLCFITNNGFFSWVIHSYIYNIRFIIIIIYY